MMSTTADRTTDTTTCPEWCQQHTTDDNGQPMTHVRPIQVGPVALEVEAYVTPGKGEPRGPMVMLPDLISLDTAREVLDYIAALQEAGAIVEGVGPDDLLCERCAPHAADEFEPGKRAGQRLARHGQQ